MRLIISIIGIVSLFYITFMCVIAKIIPIESDRANHVLQAQDILHGNIFFNDWILTGVNFLTTDLPFYEIAVLLGGKIGFNTVYITAGLMISVTVLVSVYISFYNKRIPKWYLFPLLQILFVPSMILMINLRVHTGAVVLSLIAILLAYRHVEKIESRKWQMIVGYIIMSLAVFGDKLTVLMSVAPIITYSIVKYYRTRDYTFCFVARNTFLSLICGCVLEKIYFIISSADRNSYLGKMHFVDFGVLSVQATRFFSELMKMFGVDFWGKSLNQLTNISSFLNLIVFIMAIYIICVIVIRYIKNKSVDTLSVMLTMGIVYCSLPYIFTQISQTRYITFIPIAMCIVLVRNFDLIAKEMNIKKLCYVFGVILLASQGVNIYKLYNVDKVPILDQKQAYLTNDDAEIVIEEMRKNNLKNGYASFWNASIFTVLTNGDINVRHIIPLNGKDMGPHKWFCKNDWYNDEANFVIINTFKDDLNEDIITNAFGMYNKKVEIKHFKILIYDKDLSKLLVKQ